MSVPGDAERPVQLQVTVLTPPGPGPFPMVVANHGADDASNDERGTRYRRTYFAFYFLSRGYAVVLPMMRGFAGSGGELEVHGCDVARAARDNAKDIRAVINFMAGQPDIDASRVVAIGQSFGGWNTLALGADPPPNLVGLINASGGTRTSACDDTDGGLISGAADFGRRTRVPSIWLYGDDDELFPPKLWHTMFEHYTAAGGKAELVPLGRVGPDAHAFSKYPENLPLWVPPLDAFLGRIGMPNRMIHPEYMPKPWPKPTGFAAINDVDAVPYMTDAGRDLYRRYLSKPRPKAFLIAPGGSLRSSYGGFDPVSDGLATCRSNRAACRVYAIDDQVVWTPLPPRPPPTGYAALDDVAAVPYLNDAGRDFYRRFLTKAAPRAFVLAPNGAGYSHFGPDAFAAAMLNCLDVSLICEPYAVDNDVVWVKPPPLPTASGFADLGNADAVPYLRPEGRSGYQTFLKVPKPRAFVIALDGTWISASGNPMIARYALVACAKSHQGCGIYAIDDAVVWPQAGGRP
jgi:dienelactone hydrolase